MLKELRSIKPIDPMRTLEEIAEIVNPDWELNTDQIIEKIRERFTEKEQMIHIDVIKEGFEKIFLGLFPDDIIKHMSDKLISIMRKRMMERDKYVDIFKE